MGNRTAKRCLSSFLPLLALLSCSRKAEETPLRDAANVVVTANLQDSKLPLPGAGPEIRPVKPALSFESQPWATARYFRLIDDLRTLGRESSDETLTRLAAGLYRGFYANPANYTRTTFLRGPIPSAMVGEGAGPIRDAVVSMEQDLRNAVARITALLTQSAEAYPWPRSIGRFTDALAVTDDYVKWFTKALQTQPISGPLKAVAQSEAESQYAAYRPKLAAMAEGLDRAHHVADALSALQQGLHDLNVKLPADQAETMRQANELSAQLASMQSPQDALSVLITVWRMTPAADREATFKKVSPELADFLKSKSEDELSCLAHSPCVNPVLAVAKLMIFPKLEQYGVAKLRDQVDDSVRDTIFETVREQSVKLLPTLPLLVRDSVGSETAPYFSVITRIKADVAGFVRSHVEAWASAHFNQPLKGLETSSVLVNVKSRDEITVKPAAAIVKGVVSTGADTIGASLSLSQAFLPDGDESGLKSMLVEPIMKVLAVGGFHQADGKPFPSFLLPIDGKPGQILELGSLMKEPTTYAVPDAFQANEAFRMDRAHAAKNVSTGAQAELLKGISRQIGFYRDWEQNMYDVSLGRIRVEELAPEIPKGVIKTAFLPKDILFAMSLANAGAILENLILDLSPAFLVLEDGTLLWGNHYQEIKGNKISTVAGLVSIAGGKRDGIVRTSDVARYVLALDEFMAATEGMENTTASMLQRKTKNGQSTLLADLLDIRKKLLLLQMGLTNFLVYVAQQPDGSLASTFRAGDRLVKEDSPRRLEDQALAIRALLASARRLDLPLFRWSALDVYFGMNKNFFDASRQFYAGELGAGGAPARAPSLDEIVQALLAGQELSDFMPADTRAQWEQLSKPWFKALQDM